MGSDQRVIDFAEIQKQVFTKAEMKLYLGIELDSTVDNLIRQGRLTPLKYTKENKFARRECDDLILRELANERRLRGNDTMEDSS